MNKLNATLTALADLTDKIASAQKYYSIINHHVSRHNEQLLKLHEQLNAFVLKLKLEYKRLSGKEYKESENGDVLPALFDEPKALEEFLKIEESLISSYRNVISQDILWEVLPLLAQHLTHLQLSVNKLTFEMGKDTSMVEE